MRTVRASMNDAACGLTFGKGGGSSDDVERSSRVTNGFIPIDFIVSQRNSQFSRRKNDKIQ